MRCESENKKSFFSRIICVVSAVVFCIVGLSACAPEYREFIDDGVITKQAFSGKEATGSLEAAPVGTWSTELPFYRLGFTQISDLRTDELAGMIDGISDSVHAEIVFCENGDFFCLADREAVISACSAFGIGFLDILNDASTETLAKMKKMSVGDFENVLSAHGKTKEDFAAEVSESLMRFVEKKTEQFRNYEDYGTEGLCIVYKGVYTLRGGRIYLGQTQSSVFNEGSIVADMKDEKLYIASDTDLHFFSDCEFERVN